MSVFKKVNQSKSKFQKGGFDESIVKDWQTQNEEHYNVLSGYYDKINSGGYLSADDLSAYDTALKGYVATGNKLRNINKSYGKGYTAEEDKKWTDSLTAMQSDFDNASKFYGSFETEQSFKDYLASVEENKRLEAIDLDALGFEISNLEKSVGERDAIFGKLSEANVKLQTAYEMKDTRNIRLYEELVKQYQSQITEIDELNKGLDQKKRDYTLAERYQQGKALTNNALNAEDFELYSQKGADIENPSGWDAVKGLNIGTWRPFAEKINNKVTFAQNPENASSTPELFIYSFMNEEEVSIYNYYLGKGDTASAEEYLQSIEEELNSRKAGRIVETIGDNGFLQMSFAFAAGVEQFGTGIENLFSDKDYYSQTAAQIAGGQIRENLGNSDLKIFGNTIGQIGYDIFNTTGNMMPSILVSYIPVVGQVAGAASMGLSAMGNAKAEMINLGYTKEQANTYGFLVGASEAGLQYLLGGISKLGGKASGKIGQTLVGKVDNAFARVSIKHGKNIYNALVNHAVKLGVNMASEGLEESIQTILEPWFKSIVTGEQYNAPNIDEVLYSGLLGALSAGVLEGIGTTAETVKYTSAGKAIQKAGAIDRLAKTGSLFSADSVAYQIAGRVNENTGAYTLGRLLYEVDATLTEQNKAEIAEALIQKGMTDKDAKTHAEWLSYVAEGAEMTDEQIEIIESNEVVSKVFYDVIVQRNTTEYQRMQAFAEKGKTAKVQGALQSTIKEGKNSKVAERTKGYKDIAVDILMEKMGISKATEASTTDGLTEEEIEIKAKIASEEAFNSTPYRTQNKFESKYTKKSETSEKTANKAEFSYSADGKTIYKDKEVSVKGIDSIKNGVVSVRLDNDEVVDAKDVSFSSKDEAIMYEMVADLGVNGKTATKIIELRGDTEPMLYAIEAPMAYKYGKIGYTKGLGNLTNLSYEQKTALFGLGQTDAKADAEARTEASKQGVAKSAPYEFKGEKIKKNGVEYLGVNPNELKGDLQKANVFGAEFLAKVSRLEIALYASEVKNGKRVVTINGKDILAPNGMFREGNKIYLDVNAGRKGEGTMLFTMSHEVGHYIRQWNAKAFKELGDLLFENYEGEISVEGLIDDEIEALKAQYKAENKKMPTEAELFDIAYEEVVCNALSKIFADETTFVKLAKEVKAKNKSLWAKIGEAIKAFLKKLKDVIGIYSKYDLSIRNGAMTMNMATDVYNKLQDMYVKAFVEADENYAKQSIEVNDMVQIDTDSQSVSPQFSLRTWKESEYVKEKEESAKKIAKALNVSIDVAKAYIDDINSVAKLIADDRVRLDYEASPFGSAFVGNSEYGGSFDFTTLCKKRRLYTGTFSEIQKILKDVALTPDDILKIRNMMIERGIEATCGLCYVEGSRANMGKFAKEFIRLYKRDNPNAWIPNMADVNTPDGVESMRINHPKAYEQYEYFWNHYGKLKDSDPALFASQQKPKLYESRKEYKGEITNLFKNDSTVEKKNLNGGIRMQSFSDFEIVHMIDTMQIIMDMSTVGLAGQAYTKVPEFAEAFGNTGLKINLSLIAKGVDSNGKLIFDDREGMPHDKAFTIRKKYSENVGTIIVTFTDEQLLAAMSDTRIDFIIPFHRSQWKKGQYTAMGLPKGTKDYTFMQNEKLIKQTYHEYRGKMVKDKASNYMPNEYWDFSKSGKENAEAYLKMCAENNKRPKFYKLLDYNGNGEYSLKKDGSTDGYWKLLIDFKMYNNNGVGSPQVGVKPNFSMREITRILDEYRGGHASYPIAHDVVDAFIKEYKGIKNVQTSEFTDADTQYSTRDSDGNTLSKEQVEFFKDSKVRDEQGNLLVVYHGSPSKFTEFKHSKIGRNGTSLGKGFYFTEDKSLSLSYYEEGGQLLKGYLDIKKPLIDGKKTIKKAELGKLIKAVCETQAKYMVEVDGYDSIQDAIKDTFISNYVNTYEMSLADAYRLAADMIYPSCDNDADIIGELINGGGGASRVLGEVRKVLGYDGVIYEHSNDRHEYVSFESNQFKNADNKTPTEDPDIRYSLRDLAPTFYSQMGKVVDGMKQEKFGADSVIPMLRGRGVKAEEIRWSGIATFLEGKKSVTKQELMDFIVGSQLQIGEQMNASGKATLNKVANGIYEIAFSDIYGSKVRLLDNGVGEWIDDHFGRRWTSPEEAYEYYRYKDVSNTTKWSEYKLDGGGNYRELVFTMPNSSYTNQAMQRHWGENAEGVLAHARIQDFVTADGKTMLFIEEIQSDWHNEGKKEGYEEKLSVEEQKQLDALEAKQKALTQEINAIMFNEDKASRSTANKLAEHRYELTIEISKLKSKIRKGHPLVPDAPFKDTYHEYVLKRLLRMAAEEGYGSVGWTPAWVQEMRWSEEYAEGYRIEYDQEIPKFFKKYGRQWGAKVNKTAIKVAEHSVNGVHYDAENIDVWSMDITDSMKDSVLYEGQTMYSVREGMTEEERYNELKDKKITVFEDTRSANYSEIKSLEELHKKAKSKAEKIIKPLAEKLGILNKSMKTPEVEIDFLFSKNNGLTESLSKQLRYGGSYADFAKAIINLDKVLERAVLIEVHGDKYANTVKANPNLERVYVLFSAFKDGDSIIPIQLEIKKHSQRGGRLYMTVAMTKIEAGVLGRRNDNKNYRAFSLMPTSEYSLADIFKNVNQIDRHFLKYIPNGFLTEEQKEAKQIAIQEDNERISKYSVRSENDVSNRSLLADALESVVQNEKEAEMLSKYKATIGIMEENERMLAEMKEQLFSKGIDNETRKKLRFEINKIANNINTYDKQLYRLEANAHLKAVLEREKTKAYERAKQRGRDALKAYREQVSERFSNVIKNYQESRKKAVEGRHKTILRNQLKDVVADLRRVLEKGTKERNVKIGLQETVRKALELSEVLLSDEYTNEAIARLGVPSVTDAEQELLDKYNVLLDNIAPYKQRLEKLYEQRKKLKQEGAKQDEIDAVNAKIDGIRKDAEYGKISRAISELNADLASVFVRERNRYNKKTAQDIMQALYDAYTSLKDSNVSYIKEAYNNDLADRLKKLKDSLENVYVKDMSLENLQDIYEAFKMVKHVVTDANTIFRDGRKEDLGKRIEAVQAPLMSMQGNPNDIPKLVGEVKNFIRYFSWNNLRPVDAFDRLGVEAFTELFWDAVYAQDTYARDVVEAEGVISEARKKYKYNKWDLKTAKSFKTTNGLTLKLTLADMMSIYAYSFRDQAYDHMTKGGFVFDGGTYKETDNGVTKVRVKTTQTYIVNDALIQDVIASLTKEQKAYVEEIQAYLSAIGAKGNEVSRILYGIDIFGEKHYFPLQSSSDYRSSVEQALNQTQTMVSLKNTGMTKATIPHANNPIVLRGFDEVVLEHIDKMSKYHAYVIPIENIQKVFNNSGWTNGNPVSTKALIAGVFGEEAKNYFEQYITDLNGGGTAGSGAKSPFWKLVSRGKGVAVSANLSVMAQQYFSIVRAMSEVDAKYFAPYLNGEASKANGSIYEELKRYAPVAIIKEMGGFDIGSNRGVANYIGNKNAPVDGKVVYDKVQEIAMYGAALMDKLGWTTIWRAVKKEIASTRKDLKIGTPEFLDACGKRFTEVVTKTQVYDSVNSRSGFMRSKSELTKFATAFMGEPTVIVGMWFTSINNLVRAYKTKDKAKIKEAWVKLCRNAASIVVANSLGAVSKALVQGLRDDDEDETYPEKLLEALASNLVSDINPLNYLPYFKDIVSIWEGWNVERPDMDLIGDLVNSFKKLIDDGATFEEYLALIGSVGNFFGIPLKNLIRDTRAIINTILSARKGEKTTAGGLRIAFKEGFFGKELSNGQQLYEAYMRGDKEQIKRIEGRYDKKSEAESALRQALRKNDDRISKAAQAVLNGDHAERIRLTREIVAEGHFRQDTVVSAINAEITYLRSKNK